MNVELEQISALLELQECDLGLLKVQKQFEALPQRQAILDARTKKAQIEEKVVAVKKLHDAAEAKIASIIDEDEHLAKRQEEIQHDIDAAGNDFRNMEARSKELAGQTRRREALVPKLEEAEGELAKVEAVERQLLAAGKKVQAAEQAAIESFKKEGGELQQAIVRAKAEREELASSLEGDLLARYEKLAKSLGGVAIGALSGSKCGSCRMPIDDARMVEIRRNAPLATCPHCKRFLIVK